MSLRDWFTTSKTKKLQRDLQIATHRFSAMSIAAAAKAPGGSWSGIPAQMGGDDLNKEYLQSLADVQSRAQDLDVNNPDIHGFHRTRVAQIVGKGVAFKHAPHASEIRMDQDSLLLLTQQVNRIRDIHSRLGGFDAQGFGRSEGKQQERAMLTAMVLGSCLIHRVWGSDRRYPLPLSIELIPGSRISTPLNRMGDPLISFGVQYTDEHRTRVAGWHVRRVSKTIGNNFVPDFEWDFIPVEDGSLLSLTEIAGIDRALPLSTSTVPMLRNRGQFIESAVESARAQATHYAVTECAPNVDPYALAADDSAASNGLGMTNLGGVKMLYSANGEKVTWSAARLPDPNFPGFMQTTDNRIARGLVSSLSRFTRQVNSSWAGGRLEDQQDDPIIDQYRDTFVQAWGKVNEWFMSAVWLTGDIALDGYSTNTAPLWCEFRAQFPGKVHINPADTQAAREKSLALRTSAPQMHCEEDGTDAREVLRLWAQWLKMARDMEKEYGLEEGQLDCLLSTATVSTTAGDKIEPQKPVDQTEDQPALRMVE